jgi:hypothetical protein
MFVNLQANEGESVRGYGGLKSGVRLENIWVGTACCETLPKSEISPFASTSPWQVLSPFASNVRVQYHTDKEATQKCSIFIPDRCLSGIKSSPPTPFPPPSAFTPFVRLLSHDRVIQKGQNPHKADCAFLYCMGLRSRYTSRNCYYRLPSL